MGKKVNKDNKLNKATIIRLKDLNYAKKEVIKLCNNAMDKLVLIKKDTRRLELLVEYLRYRKN